MEAADAEQAAALRAGLGDRTLDEARVAKLREVILATGALEQVEKRIAAGTEQARAALDSAAVSEQAQAALDALAVAATDRRA
jgi:geranylgeranyl diphosphate synthase, type I